MDNPQTGLLKHVKNMAAEIQATHQMLTASRYTWHRDRDANLIITFSDDRQIQLPAVPFRPYQIETAIQLFEKGIKRHLLERPRRSGKEVESWNLVIQAAITDPGLYMMVYPTNVRARAVLWDGAILMPDLTSFKFLDMIPKYFLYSINNQEMKIKLVNGSVIWVVGSDIDVNKLRGTNPRGIVYSEFAFQDPRVFYIMLPALRQNGGWLIGQSTFNGMNHFYQMIENNKNDPLWYCRVDSIETLIDENGNRYITDDMIKEDRRAGMPEYLIQQEYYGVVQINQETMYFAHPIKHILENGKLIPQLFIPNAPVYTAWDIGMNDSTAIVFFQLRLVDKYMRPAVIGYHEANNRDLAYYIGECRRFCTRYNLVMHTHFLPHDGKNKDFNTGKNTIDFLMEMGERGMVVPRPPSKENAIEAIRRKLYITDFNKENTQRLIDCLSNYSKEFDDRMGTYKNRPLHNWASHGVDAYQTMALALDAEMVGDHQYNVIYYPT